MNLFVIFETRNAFVFLITRYEVTYVSQKFWNENAVDFRYTENCFRRKNCFENFRKKFKKDSSNKSQRTIWESNRENLIKNRDDDSVDSLRQKNENSKICWNCEKLSHRKKNCFNFSQESVQINAVRTIETVFQLLRIREIFTKLKN